VGGLHNQTDASLLSCDGKLSEADDNMLLTAAKEDQEDLRIKSSPIQQNECRSWFQA